MSGYRFERYKRRREEDENELAARCARYWTHQGISQPPTSPPATANASHTGCPCDPMWPENPNQPAGCEYLSYEQLPYKPVPRGKYDKEIDFALALMGLFFLVCLIFIYRKFKRDERVRFFNEQFDLEMRARVEDAKRRAEHSGRSFVAVRQPTGELELAEVVVVVVAADEEDGDCAADREGEEERAESARTARRFFDASDEDARARVGDEETATVDEPRDSPTAIDPTSDDASAASRAR